MSISIDKSLCVGCKQCSEVCPGNLIKIGDNNKAFIKSPKDCWGCVSCVKECKVNAIKFYLGADIGGMGSLAYTKDEKDITHWIIEEKDGTVKTIDVNKKSANAY